MVIFNKALEKWRLILVSPICILVALLSRVSLFSEEEIRVQLSTESSLTPIYMGSPVVDHTPFSSTYLNELDTLLQFDFKYNGITTLVPRSESQQEILKHREPTTQFAPEKWRDSNVSYVIRPYLCGEKLSISTFSLDNGSLKRFEEIALRGDINLDRRAIHKAIDAIHHALFQSQGVASTRILYSVQMKNPQAHESISEIWECDWDGENARQITRERTDVINPVWVPSTSDRFLYVSYKHGQSKIYCASTQDGKGKRVIDLKGNQILPAISQKKDKIAFISDAGGRTDLFVQSFRIDDKDVAAKPTQLFSFPRSTQASPTFSPDGLQIAFVSDKDGSPRIYTIPAEARNKRAVPQLITKQCKENTCPVWSPDGTKLAYSAKVKGVRQIWIYDFKTKIEKQLTTGPGHKENPTWGRDSLHIAFNSVDGESSDIFVVNLNQPEAIKITKGRGKKHYPSWGTR